MIVLSRHNYLVMAMTVIPIEIAEETGSPRAAEQGGVRSVTISMPGVKGTGFFHCTAVVDYVPSLVSIPNGDTAAIDLHAD
jgi:hypothetical protein